MEEQAVEVKEEPKKEEAQTETKAEEIEAQKPPMEQILMNIQAGQDKILAALEAQAALLKEVAEAIKEKYPYKYPYKYPHKYPYKYPYKYPAPKAKKEGEEAVEIEEPIPIEETFHESVDKARAEIVKTVEKAKEEIESAVQKLTKIEKTDEKRSEVPAEKTVIKFDTFKTPPDEIRKYLRSRRW